MKSFSLSISKRKLTFLGRSSQFDSTGIPSCFKDSRDFIYYSVLNGRYIPLFKILQSNLCRNNCFYCANRLSRNCPRYEFSPKELAIAFMEYYRRGEVKGLFLSSGISPNQNTAQEKILQTIKILREKFHYRGYIHAVILPETSKSLILEMAKVSDRLSINLETPKDKYLKLLSPQKDYNSLFKTLRFICQLAQRFRLKAGVTTQYVVGATWESDREILEQADFLYKGLRLSRVYYSGFYPIKDTPLENKKPCSSFRELRLYQADILLRKYGFSAQELIYDTSGNLILNYDPKLSWALRHKERFPVELLEADFESLIRVPGIGIISAKRIIDVRKNTRLRKEDLKKMGIILKKAKDFLILNGKSLRELKDQKSSSVERQLFFWEEI